MSHPNPTFELKCYHHCGPISTIDTICDLIGFADDYTISISSNFTTSETLPITSSVALGVSSKSISFAPGSTPSFISIASADNSLRVASIDASSFALTPSIVHPVFPSSSLPSDTLTDIDTSANNLLAISNSSGIPFLFDLSSSTPLSELVPSTLSHGTCLSFKPNEAHLLLQGHANGQVSLIDIRSNEFVLTTFVDGPVKSLDWIGDVKFVVSDQSGGLTSFDLSNIHVPKFFMAHKGACLVKRYRNLVVSKGIDCQLNLFNSNLEPLSHIETKGNDLNLCCSDAKIFTSNCYELNQYEVFLNQ
ncbi:hypothetical protein P9112_014161 [Eukaryota sp. TZLM1-RC]